MANDIGYARNGVGLLDPDIYGPDIYSREIGVEYCARCGDPIMVGTLCLECEIELDEQIELEDMEEST